MLITILTMIKPTAMLTQFALFRLIPGWKYANCSGSYLVGQGYKYYADHFYRKLERILDNQSTPALDRLSTYVNEGIERFNFKRGCLIGNLSQELGPASTVFSLALEDVLQRWQAYVARCLRAVADSGELVSDINEQGRADFFWIGWEGALIRAKASASSDPVRRFASQFIRVLPKSSTVYRRGPAL